MGRYCKEGMAIGRRGGPAVEVVVASAITRREIPWIKSVVPSKKKDDSPLGV
jgi:hypothetical protein